MVRLETSKPSDPPVFTLQALCYPYYGCWNPNSSPHDCTANKAEFQSSQNSYIEKPYLKKIREREKGREDEKGEGEREQG